MNRMVRTLLALSSLLVPAALPAADALKLVNAFPKLAIEKPIGFAEANDGTGRIFISNQWGRLYVLPKGDDGSGATVFLDLKDRVLTRDNEQGFLSFALHPDFKTNRTIYLYYSRANPQRNVVARIKADAANPNVADPASEEEVLAQDHHEFGNHDGGTLLFDKAGLLYLSLGDGGAGGDPHGNGQNLGTWLGKIIRIDVDHPDAGKPYGIPKDNPFVGKEGAKPEIYAYGLRNTWRMSFDRKTGDLWAGDVGQNIWEEVDIIVKGGNYGWKAREGTHQFEKQAEVPGTIEPVIDYNHNIGQSITGGYVYRGTKYPKLDGLYLYGDFNTGRIWGLRMVGGKAENAELAKGNWHFSSFGEDQAGELYALSYEGKNGSEGKVYRIEPQ
jgi:glucose/arabinose dehydrogenase